MSRWVTPKERSAAEAAEKVITSSRGNLVGLVVVTFGLSFFAGMLIGMALILK